MIIRFFLLWNDLFGFNLDLVILLWQTNGTWFQFQQLPQPNAHATIGH